jgi:hypothetical protein
MDDATVALLLKNATEALQAWSEDAAVVAEGYWLLYAITATGSEQRIEAVVVELLCGRLGLCAVLTKHMQVCAATMRALSQEEEGWEGDEVGGGGHGQEHVSPMLRLLGNCLTCGSPSGTAALLSDGVIPAALVRVIVSYEQCFGARGVAIGNCVVRTSVLEEWLLGIV